MILQNEALWERILEPDLDKRLFVTPMMRNRQVGPGSIDLRLGSEFLVQNRTEAPGIEARTTPQAVLDGTSRRVRVEVGGELWLHPNQLALGATLEFVGVPVDLAAQVLGRSTWGRAGLLVATAVYVQPGYSGCLTLELVNQGTSPIALYPGSRIAQLVVHVLKGGTENGYGIDGRDSYIGPISPEVASIDKEREEIATLGLVASHVGQRPGALPALD